ncbi:MAG: ROK family protein [Bacteroidales bacterium]|nr:ROK family protein [Bacteroidales bacterium]
MNDKIVGVDIGGTSISAGLIVNGILENKAEIPTEAHKTKADIIENLFRAIGEVITPDTRAIGIGVPGNVDAGTGVIYNLANIPSWKEVPVRSLVEEKFGKVAAVNNDANCFVLGVKHFGIGKSYSNIVGVTLGTGLGAGIVIDNKLYTGLEGGAGEFGMIPYKDSNIENYCSGKFFSCVKKLNGADIYKRAVDGDNEAIELWNEYGTHLGNAVKVILYALAPEIIVFGGSVSKGFGFFINSLRNSLSDFVLPRVSSSLHLGQASDAESAILGAAALCHGI